MFNCFKTVRKMLPLGLENALFLSTDLKNWYSVVYTLFGERAGEYGISARQ